MRSAKLFVFAGLLLCLVVSQARGEGKAKMKGLSLYSKKCAETLTMVLEKVEGVSELSVDWKQREATCNLKDKNAAKALDKALREAGFHCHYDFDKSVLVVELTFTKVGNPIGEQKPVQEISYKEVHVCCEGCQKAITALFKDATVTFEGEGARRTVKISGKDMNRSKADKAMSEAGFSIKNCSAK